MLGLALLGAVMTNRFAANFERSLPDEARAALPPERIEAIKENPQALVDPSALTDLQAQFAAAGAGGSQAAGQFLAALKSSLAGAIGDVFTVSLVLILASLVVSVFLRPSRRASADPGPRRETI